MPVVRRIVLSLLGILLTAPAILFSQSPEQNLPPADRFSFNSLAPGLDYRHEARADGPLSIHVLRIDLVNHRWELHTGLGQGTVFGLEPLDGIVGRTARNLHKSALAAINGDFFVIKEDPYQGDPRGIQIVSGELVSRPSGNSFWVAVDGTFHIGTIASKLRVIWPDGKTETPFGLNEARPDNAVVLYTPTLGLPPAESMTKPPGTRTQDGRELVLEGIAGKPWLPLQIGTRYSARIEKIRETGNTPLAPDRMILSLGRQKLASLPPLKVGDVLQLAIDTDPDLQNVKTALGAGRILMQAGKMPEVGPANQPRHPRSMIGWNRERLYFIVIDGRQDGLSIGVTYPEMAALAKEYECSEAVELDGGGSSTLWAGGKILNSPSDGHPRPLANGLILLRKN